MMGKPDAARDPLDETQGPSVISSLHVRDRTTSKVAGSPPAWRKMSQVEAAYRLERLGPIGSNEALRRLNAGTQYAQFYDCSQNASRDSTQAFEVRATTTRLPYGEAQASAIRRLVAIECKLGERDKIILRSLCWYGYNPAQAIARAKLQPDTRVSGRICEALDALGDAIERSAKSRQR